MVERDMCNTAHNSHMFQGRHRHGTDTYTKGAVKTHTSGFKETNFKEEETLRWRL